MPQLDEKQYAHMSRILDELEPEVNKLDQVPKGFVQDMLDKRGQYGERMFVSPKQLSWLERLHEEFVGDTDHAAEGDGRDPRSDEDMGEY